MAGRASRAFVSETGQGAGREGVSFLSASDGAIGSSVLNKLRDILSHLLGVRNINFYAEKL